MRFFLRWIDFLTYLFYLECHFYVSKGNRPGRGAGLLLLRRRPVLVQGRSGPRHPGEKTATQRPDLRRLERHLCRPWSGDEQGGAHVGIRSPTPDSDDCPIMIYFCDVTLNGKIKN